jgi:hypothetical protein
MPTTERQRAAKVAAAGAAAIQATYADNVRHTPTPQLLVDHRTHTHTHANAPELAAITAAELKRRGVTPAP